MSDIIKIEWGHFIKGKAKKVGKCQDRNNFKFLGDRVLSSLNEFFLNGTCKGNLRKDVRIRGL